MSKERSDEPQGHRQAHGEERGHAPQKAKTFGVAFFETQQTALAGIEELTSRATRYGQFNIVIRDEVKNIDPALDRIARVYCGPVWWQVHEHRVSEGFYKE